MQKRKKRKWCDPVSNQGPLAPQSNVITTKPNFPLWKFGKNFSVSIFWKIQRSLLSFLQFFWISNWQNSELSRVLNTKPWQFNSNSCILWKIFVPKLHLCSLLRNIQFCTIFSAYLPFYWGSQQYFWKKDWLSNSLYKKTTFLIYAKSL